ncbi:protein serine/threonine kinase, putative [Anopheles sinensis]|uniref:Protein serine/threonine kinase, putative n=1 Tax=Anopheles sinensis TaxID=74873 RepID=A0A084WFQ0_ANOSI|nr:protein serine/threonine kinase, putative [Anopheles sinensis]
MKKSDSPWKNSMMDLFSNPESVELGPADKNPANCDLQACVMEVPPTPLVTALGYCTGVKVYVVKRQLATVERSPWTIQMLCPRNDPTQKQLFEKRLSKEAALLLQLKHPNIAGYRSFGGIDEARNFIALEYLTTSLGQILENRYNTNAGALEAYKTKRMIIHLLRGLVYLHESAHILHGDIKSFNILIKKDFENATICDFGASAPVDQEGFLDRKKAPEGRYVGTSLWSAPEVFSNNPHLICVKADIFALGMTIYETLTLTPPHTFAGIMDETIRASVDRRPLEMSLEGEEEDGYEEEGEFAEEEDQIADEEDQIADEEDDVPEEDDEVHGEDGEVHGEDGAEEGVACEAPKGEMLEMIGDEEIEALCKDIVESHKRKLADDGEEHLLKKRKTSGEESVADSVGGKSPTADEDALGNPSNDGDVPRDDEQKEVVPTSPIPEAETSFAGSDDSGRTIPMKGRTIPVSGSERRRDEQKESDPASPMIDPEVISISSDESVEERPRSGIVLEVASDSEFEEYYEEESDQEFASHADAEGEYEEDDYEDGQYLNYAVLGTRPPIPSSIEIGKEHLPLVELFYVCTESLPNDRPTARQLLDAMTKTMWEQGETDALEQQTVDDEKKPNEDGGRRIKAVGPRNTAVER